jgi:hypothetical protein
MLLVIYVTPALFASVEIKRGGGKQLLCGLGGGIGFAVGWIIALLTAWSVSVSRKRLDATLKGRSSLLCAVAYLEPYVLGAGSVVVGLESGRFLGSVLVKLFR